MATSGRSWDRDRLRTALSRLVEGGVCMGTSSWKYPGWRGQLYEEARYAWRGRFSEARFDRGCLEEYGQVFKTVCVDAAYYRFPDQRYLEELISQTPPDFVFSFKVTDEITLKQFTNLPRFGPRAGQPNKNFLKADLFASAFLAPCEPFRRRIGLLIFEFSRFYPRDFQRGRDFVEALDGFLAQLPKSWLYGVEIRNRHFLQPEYFAILARHGVAHVFNSWQAMPSVSEQMALEGSWTSPYCAGARFLLAPGRKYEEAVKLFSPYEHVKEVNPQGRAAGARLIQQGLARGRQSPTFIYVNNRFEGNALVTIEAMIDLAGAP